MTSRPVPGSNEAIRAGVLVVVHDPVVVAVPVARVVPGQELGAVAQVVAILVAGRLLDLQGEVVPLLPAVGDAVVVAVLGGRDAGQRQQRQCAEGRQQHSTEPGPLAVATSHARSSLVAMRDWHFIPFNPNRRGRSHRSVVQADRRRPGPSFPTRSPEPELPEPLPDESPSGGGRRERRAAGRCSAAARGAAAAVRGAAAGRVDAAVPRAGAAASGPRASVARDLLRRSRAGVPAAPRARMPGAAMAVVARLLVASRAGAARVVAALGLAAGVVEAAGAVALAAMVLARLRAGRRAGRIRVRPRTGAAASLRLRPAASPRPRSRRRGRARGSP